MRAVEGCGDGVGLIGVFGQQVFIDGLALSNVLDEMRNDVVVFVAPWVFFAPVVVEVLLHLLHLFDSCLFSILLQTRVDGGIDFQSTAVEVFSILLAPVLQVVGHSLTEIESLTVVVGLDAEVELNVDVAERVARGTAQVTPLHHIIQHHVASFLAVLGIGERVVGGGSFQHAHQYGSLLGGHFCGRRVEIGLTGGLDAKRIRAKVDGISIHGENLLLAEDGLQFGGDDPLFALHNEHLQSGNLAQQSGGVLCAPAHTEDVLGQLLGEGRGTTGVVMQQGILGSSKHADGVDTLVLVETLVLGVDESLPEVGIHLLELDGCAVLAEEFSNHHAIGTIDFGCLAGLWVANA